MVNKFALVIPFSGRAPETERTLAALTQWHEQSCKQAVVFLVDDGLREHNNLNSFAQKNKDWCRLITLPQNRGKGAAVRAGFDEARKIAEVVVFTDCDLHYGLNIIPDRILPMLEQSDLVIADRSWIRQKSSIRRTASGIFNRATSILTGVNYRDTQAGLKAFRTKACGPVFDLLTLNDFAFDVELLSIALFYRLRITQIPVRFAKTHKFPLGSTVRLISTSLLMLKDLFIINFNWKTGKYRSPELIEKINQSAYEID